MSALAIHGAALVVGALSWTLAEYWVHRRYGHRSGRNPFTVEHRAHHKDPMYFAPTWKKLVLACALYALLAPGLMFLVGPVAFSALGGFLCTYGAYEVVHRRLHTHGPVTAYGRWARRHHLYHHFRKPTLNHGVTSPLWDWVFGTLEVPDTVGVPRHRLLPWMLTADGELDVRYQGDFAIVTQRSKPLG